MESQHVLNPWQHRHHKQDFYDAPEQQQQQQPQSPPQQQQKNTSLPNTDAATLEDFFHGHKQVFYQSQLLLQQLQQRQQRQQKTQEHGIGEQHREEAGSIDQTSEGDDDGETDSQATAWSQLGIDSPLNKSSSTLADTDTPLTTAVIYMTDSEFGDGDEAVVLEQLVQQLQAEVKGTRATVSELETKLNLAEHSNRRIVEELKMLLADAEENLANAENSDGAHSLLQSSKGSNVSDDELNNVYNRICIALQALIDDAQSALQKNSTTKQACLKHGEEGVPCQCLPTSPASSRSSTPSPTLSLRVEPGYDSTLQENLFAARSSPRNSTTLLQPTKPNSSDIHHLPMFGPTPLYGGTDEVSRMLWKQKHEEQHDRYRKSCHRLTLELDNRFLSTDSDDSEASSFDLLRRSRHRPSLSTQSSRSSTPTTSSFPSTPITATAPNRPLQGILRSSKNTERLKKKCQVQFLNADIEGSRSRDWNSSSRPSHRPAKPSSSSNSQQQRQSEQQQHRLQPRQEPQAEQQVLRQYTHRSVSVGSNRSRGVVLQLYDLWQQTWLRTRIMHVITGSFEIVIIIWVVIKASQATLTWFGVKPKNIGDWLMIIYGKRDTAGASAKELYAKVRKDGLRMRQVNALTKKEPEALVEDLIAGVASSTNGILSPSTMVYGPAKKIVAHAVTGIALAFISDGARRLLRKL
ncbi:hypothetical protein FBU30_004296 [Linnemannia zychae]|nr:hypothetical protein FBU30_004296 [Linnemannia zychae]